MDSTPKTSKILFPLPSLKYYAHKAGIKLVEKGGNYILTKGDTTRVVKDYAILKNQIDEMIGIRLTK